MTRINQLLSNLKESSAAFDDAYSTKKVIRFIIEAKKFASIKKSLISMRDEISEIISLIEKKLASHGEWEVGQVYHYDGRSPDCDGLPSQSILKLISYRNKLKSALKKAEYPRGYYYQCDSMEKALKKGLKKGLEMPYTKSVLEIIR